MEPMELTVIKFEIGCSLFYFSCLYPYFLPVFFYPYLVLHTARTFYHYQDNGLAQKNKEICSGCSGERETKAEAGVHLLVNCYIWLLFWIIFIVCVKIKEN